VNQKEARLANTMSQTDETLVDSNATQTAKELFAGAAGGVAQVLIGVS